jgi:hypothetical protein
MDRLEWLNRYRARFAARLPTLMAAEIAEFANLQMFT